MMAHIVPATYYEGWQIDKINNKNCFYTYEKNKLFEKGKILKYRNFKRKYEGEHSYFMGENFYYIDLSIPGIYYKLKDEINDFFNENDYHISYKYKEFPNNIIEICDGEEYIRNFEYIDDWKIVDNEGKKVDVEEFKKIINEYISNRLGNVIEKNYFAYNLEQNWKSVLNSIIQQTHLVNNNGVIILNKKYEFLEFFVIQYLRLLERENDIVPTLDMVENVLEELGVDKVTIEFEKENGILSPKAYFYGLLLDCARGNKNRLNKDIDRIDKDYVIDILQAPSNYYYLTSTTPVVFSKQEGGKRVEMLFPLNKEFCVRIRKKTDDVKNGKYFQQSIAEIKNVNKVIVRESKNIVISNIDEISNLI